jgi:hypothetical protein
MYAHRIPLGAQAPPGVAAACVGGQPEGNVVAHTDVSSYFRLTKCPKEQK